MDHNGRIDAGNVDDINIKDSTMPYGIRTDYDKLINETKKYYTENDVLFVDLGDTYRLDNYRLNLNEKTYSNMKHAIGKNIDKYLKEVFNMVGENDTVYISSAFPSDLDYKNKRRLSPIIKFSGDSKGILSSATTRREGIVANLDVGVDILNEFGLKNETMVGRTYNLVEKEDNVKYVLDEFEKIAHIFGNIIDNKSNFTARHSKGISELAYNVSKHIGYSNEKCQKMKIAGLLHDIGKLATPNGILEKNGSLSTEQFCIIKSHVYYTKVILDKIEVIPDISDWASNHHEKLNGKGYPRALSSNELSEESRIMGVCDIYQALTEERPYRKSLSDKEAFSIMDDMAKNNFICSKAISYLKEAVACIK
ncbi:hypothetical protein SDC9_96743 [bioreactor metagenome]|uniref:HD-GYP domain-containing protein n=1 Tax=bioreactor metagenome TaxID=1076179 RepID=A0A645A9Y2_9ZZZZ